ncbi:MAG: hypothetical protein Q4B53_01850 [Lachnospiraceae bacterium]|nr:hypothetical protein [Lachnospiraceae bacterium]
MNDQELLNNILLNSSFESKKSEMDEFSILYVTKLVSDIILYVDADISLGDITFCDSYNLEHEVSQEITGIPSAYSALDGNIKVLTAFAESYSNLGIAEFDSLCRESLLDFLNLHNGLFVVELSEKNICELSLGVPKQGNSYEIKPTSSLHGHITLIPITFSYGTITFVLLRTS